MIKKNIFYSIITIFTIISALFFASCERDPNVLEPANYPDVPEVFIDGFSAGLNYAAFGGSKVTAFDVDKEVKYKGTASMRIEVPDFEDPMGAYAGGAYFTEAGRNLTGYDALTFWAKSSLPANIDIVGIGNDLGLSRNLATITGLAVNTNWKKYIIPIPDASRFKEERGMFFYSEGPENNLGYTIWFDEVKFEKLGTIAHPRPYILNGQDQNTIATIGQTLSIGDIYVLFNMPDGTDERVNVSPSYFTFTSSDESVATVNENGQITILAMGSAKITAAFGSKNAVGSITVNVEELPVPAPVPTVPSADVISLFSNAYTNVPVDTWATGWLYSTAVLQEIQINGDDVKLYTNLNFNGIEFASQTIDATQMTRFHMDIWTPDPTTPPAAFKVLLVDFGADGVFGGGDDVSHELTFTANTNPGLTTKQWVQIDVPLSAFTGLTTKAHLAQLVISGDLPTVYVDNVYFYKQGGGTGNEPTTPAPTPTYPAGNVISLFSDAYTNVPVDTWRTDWSSAVLTDVNIAGNPTKKYSQLDFVGIETVNNQLDISSMTNFHIDVWSPDFTLFGVKLVDFGADGAFGGGDDVEHQVDFNSPVKGGWVSLDIPLSDFTGLTTKNHIAQYILIGQPTGTTTVYVDNVLFHR
jgi:hypothetical protein